MRKLIQSLFPVISLVFILSGCSTKDQTTYELYNPLSGDEGLIRSINGDTLIIKDGALMIRFSPGEYGSVITIRPPGGVWDGSAYRFVRCEIENPGTEPQLVELGFGDFDLTLGGTIVSPGQKKVLKAVIYRNQHPAYIDSLFPVMHGKPDGTLRSWMRSTSDSIEYIRLLFPTARAGQEIKIGRIWLEDPYILYSADELTKKYFPFVDRFGQLKNAEWPAKIHNEADLKDYGEKEKADLEAHPRPNNWNKYGGWESGPRLRASGRFRVEKYNGKWWFVDPDGKLFWSNGFDCVEFGRQSQTRVSGRENYFEYLPRSGSPESLLYYISGEGKDTLKHLSFHALNLYRKYGENWKEISNESIHQRLASWGFNTIGNWSDRAIYMQQKTPYVLTAYSQKTGEISDPYLPDFGKSLLSSLTLSKDELNDPWCIGVFVDNELKWGVKWASKIGEQVLIAPPEQPAKHAFRKMLAEKYPAIDVLNQAWGTTFVNWDQLMSNRVNIPGAMPDIELFMREFATQYYKICRDAVREAAPELLYLGCRMDFHLYPEDTSLNEIIKIAAKYCDVVSFNRYRYSSAELIPPGGGDYPIIIGEYHFGSLETGLLQPGLRYAADQNERAELLGYYLTDALRNPYIIGAHWFQLVDQSVTGRGDGENYQAGFLTVGDVPQQEMISQSREIGAHMYDIRMEDKLGTQDIPEYSKRVDQVLWVVDDLNNTIAQWTKLGFSQVMELGNVDAHLKKAGKEVRLKMAKANLGGANITWVQPSGDESVFSEFHNSYGNGAMSLVHRLDNKNELMKELSRLSALGMEIKEEITIKTSQGNLYFILLDTKEEGKYYLGLTFGDEDVKMMQKLSSANRHHMKINQYAFAIRQAEKVSKFWHKAGQPEFQINHPELGNKHYYGKVVDHDLIQGWQRHGSVAYEWCVPVKLPIVYDDHIRKHGEGIHHLAFTVDNMDTVLADYTSKGFVISMGGTWGEPGKPGSGRYEYIDLEHAGGLTMELLWSQP